MDCYCRLRMISGKSGSGRGQSRFAEGEQEGDQFMDDLEMDSDEPLLMSKQGLPARPAKSNRYSSAQLYRKTKYLSCVVLLLLSTVVCLICGLLYVSSVKLISSPRVIPACNIDGQSCVGYRQFYKKDAIASDQPICSQIGNVILSEKGGNIVDAGIAVLICLGVANLQSAGVGGGGFLMYHSAVDNKTHLINARETAPSKAFKDMFKHNYGAAVEGGLAIAIPGEVAGYWAIHSQFGKLPWKELFTPTIKLCTDGFAIGSGLDLAIRQDKELIFKYKGLKEMLVDPHTGDVMKTGDILKLPKLAHTLERIANGGVQEYYNGSLAEDIVADIQEVGGIISKEDLSGYVVKSGEAMAIKLRDGHTMYSVPPPSSGALMAFIYNVMDGYRWRTDTLSCTDASVLFHHRLTESWKYAYSIRYRMGDEDFVNMDAILKNITSIEFADYIRSQINDNETYEPKHYGPVGEGPRDHGTTHLSLLDAKGNAFAATTSINQYFGSKIVGSRTGIIFDDTMDDFSVPNKTNRFNLPPSATNFIMPGKRPMSTMCPTIITDKDGDVVMVVGASGGSKILTASSYVTLRSLLLNDDLKTAVDATRIHHQWIPNHVTYEWELDPALYNGLRSKGHNMNMQPKTERGAVVQALLKNYIQAYCDMRKGGCPSGHN